MAHFNNKMTNRYKQKWRKLPYQRLWSFAFLAFALLLSAHTVKVNFWDSTDDGTRIRIDNNVSDWAVKFTYEVFEDNADFRQWEWADGAGMPSSWEGKDIPFRSAINGGSIQNNVQNGRTVTWLHIGPGGTRLNSPGNGSKVKIKANFDGDDSNYENRVFSTHDLYAPDSLWVTNFGISNIDLEWEKGTDVPEDKHKYILIVKDLSSNSIIKQDTLDGSKRTAKIKGLDFGTNFEVKLATYTPGGKLVYDGIEYANWGAATSTFLTLNQATENFNMEASDGNFSSRVRVNWSKLSGNDVSDFRILRSKLPPNQNQFEELAILNRQATAHNDFDAIPGVVYTYKLQALGATGDTLAEIPNDGYGKPIGAIQGRVQAVGNIGVKGIEVCAQPKNPITPAGSPNLPPPGPKGYCVNTTVTGRFEIRNLYFFDSATFVVTPNYRDHGFDPEKEEVILDLTTPSVDNLSFLDTSSIGLGGRLYFPLASEFGGTGADTIPVAGATILVDSTDQGVRTDSRGFWRYGVKDTGTYVFKPVYKNHKFATEGPPRGADSVKLDVKVNKLDINFVDLQKDSIDMKVQDACGGLLAGGAPINLFVRHKNGINFFEKTIPMNAQGTAEVVLPATEFRVEMSPNQPPALDPNQKAQLDSLRYDLDLSERDTLIVTRVDTTVKTIPADTVIVGSDSVITPARTVTQYDTTTTTLTPQPTAHYQYYAPFRIELDWEQAGAYIKRNCSPTGSSTTDSVILVNSTENYRLNILVYDSDQGCLLDTGSIQIYDFVGDKESSPQTFPISKGKLVYDMVAGEPNSFAGGAHPYEKAFFLNITAGSRKNQPFLYWLLVQGTDQLTPTFTSRSPQIPDLVIHDPPGDGSYAWVEKGSSYSLTQSISGRNKGGGNVIYANAILGFNTTKEIGGLIASVETEIGLGLSVQGEWVWGEDSSQVLGKTFSYEFAENFSTSADPIFTGNEGDVYIGKATNQRYSIARVLLYDTTTCMAEVRNLPNLDQTSIATTFMYTEKHIQGILIPQLKFLELSFRREASREADPDKKKKYISDADSFQVDATNWTNIVAQNARQRDSLAVDTKKNISFSAGAPYEATTTHDTTSFREFEYLEYDNWTLGGGLEAVFKGAGPWVELSAGYLREMRSEEFRFNNKEEGNFFSVGYHLEDDDFGDYFSVDILTDTVYKVPAFRMYGGTSSCPHEAGTQPRDKASITITPPRVDNVDPNKPAEFTATLTNKSESFETREYHIKVISATNTNGAVVSLGGYDIMNDPVSYFLDTLAYDVVMSVSKGPKAVNYQNIGIMMYPPCEYELWENNGNITSGDTAWVTVNFQTECTPVSIVNPDPNWFINDRSGQVLTVDFGGYDKDNGYLETITLEYKRQGTNWTDGPQVQKAALTGDLHRVSLDFTNLPDGRYWLRARANCTANQGVVYSPEVEGIVDRYSKAPFGRPFPNDGFLRNGKRIFVKWDVPIDTAFSNTSNYLVRPTVVLRRTDNDRDIPFTISWSSDSTIMYLDPVANIFQDPSLRGVAFEARVEGVRSGIAPDYDQQVYPVVWNFQVNTSPVFWDPDYVEGEMFTNFGTSLSSSLQNVTGQLKRFKLTRYPSWLIPSDTSGFVLPYNAKVIEFAANPQLPPGSYKDTVVAEVDGTPEYLTVAIEAASREPSWVVKPERYQFTMSVVAVFSLDNTNTNLAADSLDKVAAVVDGDIRGVANLQYVPEVNKYIAFLTVHSNAQFGEKVRFRLFRKSTGEILGAKEKLTFAMDRIEGRIQSPYILHAAGTYQFIPLDQGWNWVSFNRDAYSWTREDVFYSLLSPFRNTLVTVLNKAGQMSVYQKANQPYQYLNFWSGNLNLANNREMFMVYLNNEPDTLKLLGPLVSSPVSQPCVNGWNWLSYPSSKARSVNDAMGSMNFKNYDLLKSQDAFAEYHRPATKWIGELRMMKPGEGYRLHTRKNAGNLQFPVRKGREAFQVVDHHQYETQMPLIGTISFADGGPGEVERLLVGAFMEDTCRGVGYLEYIEEIDEYRVLFGIHGNTSDFGREVKFRVFDTFTGEEYTTSNEPVMWLGGQFLGQADAPYELMRELVLSEGGYRLEQNVPNPYDNRTTISYTLPKAETISLTVYDQLGQVVKVLVNEPQEAGEHSISFDASDLPSGIYHYSLRAGAFRTSRKMVKF
jgi:hypothetical protein